MGACAVGHWATIAFYGPDAIRTTKAVVSIFPVKDTVDPSGLRDWHLGKLQQMLGEPPW